MSTVGTGQQARARRGADSGTRITLGEAHSFLSQLVYVGSFELLLSVTTEVTESEVVGQDENDVGSLLILDFLFLCKRLLCSCYADKQRATEQ